MKRILSLVLVFVMLASTLAVLSSCDRIDPALKGQYTYNSYMSVFPTKWNNHTYETATDSEIIGYTELGFYTFDYNETMDGFQVVPEMAVGDPVDVTADYVGEKWGIEEGETARAWKITIRDDLRWENGDPITAHDFETSAQLLLNPVANNYRADSLYAGELQLVNAEAYFWSNKLRDKDHSVTQDYARADLVKGDDGVYTTPEGYKIWITLTTALDWLGGNTLDFYVNYFTTKDEAGNPAVGEDGKVINSYFDYEAYQQLKALADDKGNVQITDESLELLTAVITAKASWGETAEHVICYMYYQQLQPVFDDWDSVGINAVSDNEIVIVLNDPLSGFYLLYNLTGSLGLVHEKTYRACASVDPETGVYTNTYGTSVDTYMSYGPYKLTTFLRDKQIVLERNDQWYGYSDPANEGCYQTSRIVFDWIDDPETAMQAFLQGKLDAKGLDVDYIKEYEGSEHLYYSDGSSTFFVAMNPNETAFKAWEAANPGKDKSIITVLEFRQALSFSLDRTAFNLATSPDSSPAFAIFNSQICSDPENGKMYRTEDAAKDVILEFWGISQDDIGAGKLYANKDEAIASITGYNPVAAKELFNQAYDKAVAAGIWDGTTTIEFCIGLPNGTSKFYTNGYNFLTDCWTEAVKGTKLEGKLTFTKDDTLGNGFADALRGNNVDILFGVGWTGSQLNPFGLIEAYTTSHYQYDPAWDTSTAPLEFEIDGVAYTASVLDWTNIINGVKTEITKVDAAPEDEDATMVYSCGLNDGKTEERIRLLAALEGAVLRTYDLLPLNNESSAALKGMQINYYTEEEVYGLGRGGIKYMTYNYDDYDWEVFVRDQGGTLNYK